MIYFTSPNDTAEKVAGKFISNNINELAKKIREENRNSRAVCSMGGDHFMAPNRPLWVPYAYQPDNITKKNIVTILDQLPSNYRNKFRQAQRSGVSYQHLMAMSYLVNLANQDAFDQGLLEKNEKTEKKDDDDELTLGGIIYSGVDSTLDARNDRLSKFLKAVHQANADAKTLAENIGSANERTYWVSARESLRDLNSEYGHEMKNFNLHNSIYFRKPVKGLQQVRKLGREGFTIFDTEEARAAIRIARGMRVLATTGFVVDIGCDLYKIRDKYLHGGDWQKELLKDSGEIGIAISIPWGLSWFVESALMLTPVGWLGAIGMGVSALIGTLIAEHYWKKALK